MQELLFGNNKDDNNANLRPSHNSAFQKYVPSANVPSTADINNINMICKHYRKKKTINSL